MSAIPIADAVSGLLSGLEPECLCVCDQADWNAVANELSARVKALGLMLPALGTDIVAYTGRLVALLKLAPPPPPAVPPSVPTQPAAAAVIPPPAPVICKSWSEVEAWSKKGVLAVHESEVRPKSWTQLAKEELAAAK